MEKDNYRQKQRMAAHPDDEAGRRVWPLRHNYTVSGTLVQSELTSNPEKRGKEAAGLGTCLLVAGGSKSMAEKEGQKRLGDG